MRAIVRAATVSAVVAGAAVAWNVPAAMQAQGQAPAAIEPLHFHHVHLNSVDPEAAADLPADLATTFRIALHSGAARCARALCW